MSISKKESSGWSARANAAMLQDYCIDLSDVGLDEDEIAQFAESFPDPRAFVVWFANKFNLTSAAEVNFGRPLKPPSSRRPSAGWRR